MPDEFDELFNSYVNSKRQAKAEEGGGGWWNTFTTLYDKFDQSWLPDSSESGMSKLAGKVKSAGFDKVGRGIQRIGDINYGITDALVGSPIRAAGTAGTLATLPLSAPVSLAARVPAVARGVRGLDAINAIRMGGQAAENISEGEDAGIGNIIGAGLSGLGALTPIKTKGVGKSAANTVDNLTPTTSARIVPEPEAEQMRLGLDLFAEPHQNISQTIRPTNNPGPARNYRQVIGNRAPESRQLPPRTMDSIPSKRGVVAVDKPDIYGPGRRVNAIDNNAETENIIRYLTDNEMPVTEATIREVRKAGNFPVDNGLSLPGGQAQRGINFQDAPTPKEPTLNTLDLDLPKDEVLPMGTQPFHKSPLDEWDAGTPLFPSEVGQHSKIAPQGMSPVNTLPANAGGTRNVLQAPVPEVKPTTATGDDIRKALAERGVVNPSDELVATLRKDPERLRRMGLIRDEMVGAEAPPNQIKGLLPVGKREVDVPQQITQRLDEVKQMEIPGFENKLDAITASVSDVDPELGKMVQQAKTAYNPATIGQQIYRGMTTATGQELRNMGEGGARIAQVLDLIGTDTPRLYNNLISEWNTIKEGINPKTFESIVDHIEGTKISANKEVIEKAEQLKAFLARTGKLGESVEIFKPRAETYFPHRYASDSKTLAEFRNALRKAGKSEADIDRMLGGATEHDIGKIAAEYSRNKVAMPGYRKDMEVIDEHIRDLSKRVTEAQYLGPKGLEDASSPISLMIKNSEDPNRASDLINRILSRDVKAQGWEGSNKIANFMQTAATASYLSMMRISNLGGTLPVAMQTTLRDTANGFKEAFKASDDMKFMDNVNGYQSVARNIAEAYTHSKVVDKVHGISQAQNFMNKVAAGAAKSYAENAFDTLKAGKGSDLLRRRLEDLLLEPLDSVLKQKELTKDQLERVMVRGAEITQGVNEGRKLPHEWNRSGIAKIPQIFMRYNYQTTKMLYDAIKQDPVRNIPKLLATGAVVGEILGDAKETVRTVGEVGANQIFGDKEKGFGETLSHNLSTRRQQFTEKRVGALSKLVGTDLNEVPGLTRAVANLEAAFALGIPFDLLNQFAEGGGRGVNPLDATVAVSELKKASGAAYNTMTGNFRDVGREAVSRIPFVGRGIASEIPTSAQLNRKSKKAKKGKYFKRN